jgi:excisionase family DNA binding protein
MKAAGDRDERDSAMMQKRGGHAVLPPSNPESRAANFPAILTKQQAAASVQSTPRFLEQMVRIGRLGAFKPTGRFWRVRRTELDRFLEAGSTMGGER